MRFRTLHCTPLWHGVVFIVLLAGCWEKIEYTGPDPSTVAQSQPANTIDGNLADAGTSTVATSPKAATNSTSAASDDGNAGDFGDDLANFIADEPSAAVAESEPPGAAVPSDDRYSTNVESVPTQPDTQQIFADTDASERQSDQPPTTENASNQSETGATPVSTTVDSSPASSLTKTRHAAWVLGSRLGFAALANDSGFSPDKVPVWFAEARTAAESLGTKLADLPPAEANAVPSKEVLNYLFVQGQQVNRDLASHYGPDHAALFEVAMKSSVLLVLYTPGSTPTTSIGKALAEAGPRAQLPEELWRPLVDDLAGGASLDTVRAAVHQMHTNVEQHLATAAAPVEH